jgi:hypothetical protein
MEVHAMRIARTSLALLSALALSSTLLVAQGTGTSGTHTIADRFTFVAPNAPESTVDPDRLHVGIHRWSTDEERDRLFQLLSEKGADRVLHEFRATGSVGHIRWPGGLEYSLRYAYRTPRPDGGHDVMLIADRPIWVWWDQSAKVSTEPFTYTAVQIRLNKGGTGEGRMAGPDGVAAHKSAGIELRNYDQLTARLTDVREDRQS